MYILILYLKLNKYETRMNLNKLLNIYLQMMILPYMVIHIGTTYRYTYAYSTRYYLNSFPGKKFANSAISSATVPLFCSVSFSSNISNNRFAIEK